MVEADVEALHTAAVALRLRRRREIELVSVCPVAFPLFSPHCPFSIASTIGYLLLPSPFLPSSYPPWSAQICCFPFCSSPHRLLLHVPWLSLPPSFLSPHTLFLSRFFLSFPSFCPLLSISRRFLHPVFLSLRLSVSSESCFHLKFVISFSPPVLPSHPGLPFPSSPSLQFPQIPFTEISSLPPSKGHKSPSQFSPKP